MLSVLTFFLHTANFPWISWVTDWKQCKYNRIRGSVNCGRGFWHSHKPITALYNWTTELYHNKRTWSDCQVAFTILNAYRQWETSPNAAGPVRWIQHWDLPLGLCYSWGAWLQEDFRLLLWNKICSSPANKSGMWLWVIVNSYHCSVLEISLPPLLRL